MLTLILKASLETGKVNRKHNQIFKYYIEIFAPNMLALEIALLQKAETSEVKYQFHSKQSFDFHLCLNMYFLKIGTETYFVYNVLRCNILSV